MKKITLLAFLMATLLLSAQEVLNENFDESLSIPTGWTNNDIAAAGDSWAIGTGSAHPNYAGGVNTYFADLANFSGNYAYFNSDADSNNLLPENVALESPVFDCSDLTTVILSYNDWFIPDFGGGATVETSTDGGVNWTVVYTYTAVEYGSKNLDISSFLSGQSTAQIRFRWTGDFSYNIFIDNVVVQQPLGDAPDAVTDMIPADGATDVEIMTFLDASNTLNKMIEFSWSAATTGDPATSFDVSIGTDQTLGIGTLNNFTSGSGILYGTDTETGWMPNTTYYWKVTANNVAGSTDSAIYVFTTGADDPLGVNDVTIETFKAFPNPVIDILTIEGNKPIDSVEIVNQLGQSVLKVDLNSMFNNQINLSKLNTGIYFVKVKSASKTEILQVIKQ